MNLAIYLKNLRRDLGLSQEAFGAQGFISAPGWIKIENGQRQASEKLIERLSRWLVDDKYMKAGDVASLKEELLTLKYLGSRSTFVREMAKTHAKKLFNGEKLLQPTPNIKPVRGRPRKHPATAVALVAEESGSYKVRPKKKAPIKK